MSDISDECAVETVKALSTRIRKVFEGRTVGQLRAMTNRQLRRESNIGPKCVMEIRDVLGEGPPPTEVELRKSPILDDPHIERALQCAFEDWRAESGRNFTILRVYLNLAWARARKSLPDRDPP